MKEILLRLSVVKLNVVLQTKCPRSKLPEAVNHTWWLDIENRNSSSLCSHQLVVPLDQLFQKCSVDKLVHLF